MKKWIVNIFDKLRRATLTWGYTCDGCGGELFDYPVHRLCADCEGKLLPVRNPCSKCGRERIADGLCLDCKATPPAFTKGISPFVYKGEGGILTNRMKNGNPRIAAYFGERMAERFIKDGGVDTKERLFIIAVPMTKAKKRERGYNQAERLAEGVSTRLKEFGYLAETYFDLLEKRRETKAQKKISRKERAENLKGAFHLKQRKFFQDRTVLLIDDVMTTGATGSECARKLLGAGAKAVYFLTATSLAERK